MRRPSSAPAGNAASAELSSAWVWCAEHAPSDSWLAAFCERFPRTTLTADGPSEIEAN